MARRYPLALGDIVIELVYKKSLDGGLSTQDFVVATGYLQVSTPELLVIATVLSELTTRINDNRLIELAEKLGEICQIQRLCLYSKALRLWKIKRKSSKSSISLQNI